MEAGRVYFLALWRNPVVSLLLYGSLVAHVALAFLGALPAPHAAHALWEARSWRSDSRSAAARHPHRRHADRVAGLRRRGRVLRVALSLWALAPDLGSRQVLIVGLAWVHAMIGVHSIVKLRAWYPRAAPWLLGVVVLVPVLGILGFVNGGRQPPPLARDPARAGADALARTRAAHAAGGRDARAGPRPRFVGYTTLLGAVLVARGVRQRAPAPARPHPRDLSERPSRHLPSGSRC